MPIRNTSTGEIVTARKIPFTPGWRGENYGVKSNRWCRFNMQFPFIYNTQPSRTLSKYFTPNHYIDLNTVYSNIKFTGGEADISHLIKASDMIDRWMIPIFNFPKSAIVGYGWQLSIQLFRTGGGIGGDTSDYDNIFVDQIGVGLPGSQAVGVCHSRRNYDYTPTGTTRPIYNRPDMGPSIFENKICWDNNDLRQATIFQGFTYAQVRYDVVCYLNNVSSQVIKAMIMNSMYKMVLLEGTGVHLYNYNVNLNNFPNAKIYDYP